MSHELHIEPGLHENVEASLGTGDLRMIYGLGVPTIAALALIVAAVVTDAIWLAGLALVAVLALAALIIRELVHMLDETGD
jgi:hypothetical protein